MSNTIKCKSCSKEITDRVPIMRVIAKAEEFFEKNDLDSAKSLFCYWENEALRMNDTRGLLEILSELVGLYRRTGEKEKGLKAVDDALKIIKNENMENLTSAGTVFINCATTLKAFGEVSKALPLYEKAADIYEKNKVSGFKKAALYNNAASSFCEIKNFEKAKEYYLKALDMLNGDGGFDGEKAVTFVNLAHCFYDENPLSEEWEKYLENAWEILMSKNIPHDGNFAFICSKCAPSFGYFGYFLREKQLIELAEKIYERN